MGSGELAVAESGGASLPSIGTDAMKRRVHYFYEPSIGDYYYGQGHPMKPHRIRMAHNLIVHYSLHHHMQINRPFAAEPEDIRRFHSDDYVEFLSSVSPEIVKDNSHPHNRLLKRFNVGDDCPVFDGLFPFCQASAGGSIGCAARLNRGDADIAINWAGGLHHAKKAEASGFCYVNDIVLGILELLKAHRIHMDGHDSIMGSDTEAHSGSTPQPPVSNNANMGPPKRKSRSNRSACWDHFTPMPRVEGVKAANCNYCKTRIQYSGGTSAMRAHLRRCNLYPPNMMMHESASSSLGNREVVVNSSPAVPKFDQEVSRIDLVNMFVALELPFQKVEHPYFRKFVYGLQPKFMLPSRITLAREILKNWDMEKAKLKSFLSQHCRRVCLTTDTWTSTQNFNYMCLTAHFIDNNWKLQKKVLNFMQVTEYTGEIMAKTVKECLNGWELGRVLSVTVDNASSNDVGIRHLKRWLLSQNGLVSNGEHLHTRCCAHILNLIVKDGLTIVNESILRIRSAVRYVRRTPSRFQRFKKCIDRETITFKGYVGLDCETRWNATYTMLNSAVKHMKTFIELEFTDQQYVNEMSKEKGVPTLKDWEEVGSILPFLKIFHDATVRVSGSSYLTSNLYMLEVFGI